MGTLKAGIIAGFIATVALLILMIIKAALGMLPAFNAIVDNAHLVGAFTPLPPSMALGWVSHFLIGTVLWGAIYTWLRPSLLGGVIMAGVLFGVIAWLAMMIIFMPLVGHGFFAMALGIPVVITTLVLHIVYGAVLGFSFDRIKREQAIA